jgi:hypothetical protein
MSTISLSQPVVMPVRPVRLLGTVLILSSLVTLAITILVLGISTSNADPASQAAVSQNSIVSLAFPVPAPAPAEMQSIPVLTAAIHPEAISGPSVVPVPVPVPPQ